MTGMGGDERRSVQKNIQELPYKTVQVCRDAEKPEGDKE